MYFLREGSANTDAPHFERLPMPPSTKDGNQLMFFPEKSVAKWFYEAGMAEKNLIHWVSDTFIDPTKNFIDIGAHVGTYAWTCGKKAAHTYAFECSPKTFCYLAANIALQGLEERISPFPFALGNADGHIDYFVRSADGGGNGVKSLSTTDSLVRRIKIPMKMLDSFGLANIGFIKIDVEGFEKEVLEGALETLRTNDYPTIMFESWGDWKNAEGVDATKIRTELFAFLTGLKYKVLSVANACDTYLAVYDRTTS
jgi:FkbM family methyltransferase